MAWLSCVSLMYPQNPLAWDHPCAEKAKPQGTQTAEAQADSSLEEVWRSSPSHPRPLLSGRAVPLCPNPARGCMERPPWLEKMILCPAWLAS